MINNNSITLNGSYAIEANIIHASLSAVTLIKYDNHIPFTILMIVAMP